MTRFRAKVFVSTAFFCLFASLCATAPVQFTDIGKSAGLNDIFFCGGETTKKYIIETLGGGVALFDYDNDGYVDAFFVTGSTLEGFPQGREPTNQLYRNNHDGTFTKTTSQARLAQSGWGQGVCVGDYDNDGFDDLFVTYYGQNHLYHNTGKGTFEDVTKPAGLQQETRWGTGCAFVDYDLDGRLDLFVANYIIFDKSRIPLPGTTPDCTWKGMPVMCGPRGLPGGTNQLFHNEGNGKFTNASEHSGIAAVGSRYSLSVTTLDFDRDGWPDIYVAVDSQPSILYHNNRNGTFSDVGVTSGVAYSEDGREQAGMGSAAADFDGDGNLDLVKTNFIEDTANLYRNNGDGSFEDYVHASGLSKNTQFMGWGVGFLDYDNDGWPDIFMANGHVYPEIERLVPNSPYRQRAIVYHNVGGRTMEDVTDISGSARIPHSSRGVAFADFDNDGDVDIFVNNMNERPGLLRNDGGNQRPFISIKLVGIKSNRNGIGARVALTAGGRKQVQEVRSGSSFLSHSDFRLHFGLGTAAQVDLIEIQWPFHNSFDKISGIQKNQFVTVTEGEGVTDARKVGTR